jgi:hypothetical protein
MKRLVFRDAKLVLPASQAAGYPQGREKRRSGVSWSTPAFFLLGMGIDGLIAVNLQKRVRFDPDHGRGLAGAQHVRRKNPRERRHVD